MDLHRLRVVDYDRKSTKSEISFKENEAKLSKEHTYENNNENKLVELPLKLSLLNNSQQLIYAEGNVTGTSCKQKRDENHTKDLVSSIWPAARTLSLNDIEDKLKKCDSLKIKQRHKRKVKSIRLKQNLTRERGCKESQDDIKVLYTCQRVVQQINKKPSCNEIQRTNRVSQLKRPSHDLFNRQSMSKLRTSEPLYCQICKSVTRKRKNRGTTSLPHILRYPLEMNNKRNEICQKHYNVVDFPNHDRIDHHTQTQQQYTTHLEYVVAPSKITVQKGHCKKTTSRINKAVVTEPLFTCVKFKHKKKSKLKCNNNCAYLTDDTTNVEKKAVIVKPFRILRNILKYVLLCVTVIAWSPCILVAFICWRLVSPLTPADIMADEVVVPSCVKCRKSFFSRLVKCITRLYKKTKCAFETVKRSVNFNEEITRSTRYRKSVGTQKRPIVGIDSKPNPNRTYVLYHSQQRGWLMKPMQGSCKPKQLKSNVCPNLVREHSPTKKSVSFWDSKLPRPDIMRYNIDCKSKGTITPSKPKRSFSCSCIHEPPAVPSPVLATCPISKFTKRVRCSVDNSKFQSLNSSSLMRQSRPRKIYSSCPHYKTAPCQRPLEKNMNTQRFLHKCNRIPTKNIYRPCQRIRSHRISCESTTASKRKKSKKTDKVGDIYNRIKHHFSCIEQSDRAWEHGCGNLYISTLSKKPCFWVYKWCPNMYPLLLATSKLCHNCCMVILFICSACVWCPIFLCFYLCCELICDLMCCSC